MAVESGSNGSNPLVGSHHALDSALSLLPVPKARLPGRPLVMLIPGAVRAAFLVERVVVPLLLFLLFGSLMIGCQSTDCCCVRPAPNKCARLGILKRSKRLSGTSEIRLPEPSQRVGRGYSATPLASRLDCEEYEHEQDYDDNKQDCYDMGRAPPSGCEVGGRTNERMDEGSQHVQLGSWSSKSFEEQH